jgi:hypothetical protein
LRTLTRFRLTLLVVWILTAVGIAVIVGNLNWVTYWRLSKRGVATTGHVTRTDRNNHLAVYYSYAVDGKAYSGDSSAGSPAVFDQLAVGHPISVYYLIDEPGVSCWGAPDSWLRNETLAVAMGSILMPSFLVLMLYLRFADRFR